MKTIRNACELQPNALDINVGDQIEQLDQIINETDGHEYFQKTFITDGMKTHCPREWLGLPGSPETRFFISNRPWVVVKRI